MNALIIAAAVAALHVASAHTDCHEYAGAVLEQNSAYMTTALQQGTADEESPMKIWLRPGQHLVAIFHTHPRCNARKTDQYFSVPDVQAADRLNVPSFIWVGYDDTIRMYIPHHTPTEVYTEPLDPQGSGVVSLGEIIK